MCFIHKIFFHQLRLRRHNHWTAYISIVVSEYIDIKIFMKQNWSLHESRLYSDDKISLLSDFSHSNTEINDRYAIHVTNISHFLSFTIVIPTRSRQMILFFQVNLKKYQKRNCNYGAFLFSLQSTDSTDRSDKHTARLNWSAIASTTLKRHSMMKESILTFFLLFLESDSFSRSVLHTYPGGKLKFATTVLTIAFWNFFIL